MTFGERIRELRRAKRLTLRELSAKVAVGSTYLSKIENHKLEAGHCPSETLIHKLAVELDGDEDELLLLADKVPVAIQRRVFERPDAFRLFADLDDTELDSLVLQIIGK